MSGFPSADRTLASVAALGLFALNEARMFQFLPRSPDPGQGQIYAVTLQLMGTSDQVYLSALDMAARWGFIGLTVGLCVFALAETLRGAPAAKVPQRKK